MRTLCLVLAFIATAHYTTALIQHQREMDFKVYVEARTIRMACVGLPSTPPTRPATAMARLLD